MRGERKILELVLGVPLPLAINMPSLTGLRRSARFVRKRMDVDGFGRLSSLGDCEGDKSPKKSNDESSLLQIGVERTPQAGVLPRIRLRWRRS